jgi:hypothetical protein
MMPLLSLDVNLVIYIERKGVHFVESVRAHFGHAHKTHVLPINGYEDVHFYDLLPAMRVGIAKSYYRHWVRQEFRSKILSLFLPWQDSCPGNGRQETQIAEYGWVNHAKVGWVHDAIVRGDFGANYFVWIDAGAGKGNHRVCAHVTWPSLAK